MSATRALPKEINRKDFFGRFYRIMIITVVIATALSVGLMLIQVTGLQQSEDARRLTEFNTKTLNLEYIIRSATDHVNLLQNELEDFSHVATPDVYSPFAASMSQINPKLYGLVSLPQGIDPNSTGYMVGLGKLNQLDHFTKQEIRMVYHLNAAFRGTQENMPNAAWIYYTSNRRFIHIYPYKDAKGFVLENELFNHEFFSMGLPENNPERKLFWTSAYMDEAGKGLMVTCAKPVYMENQFRGTVAIDLTLEFLNEFVRDFVEDGVGFIVNERYQILAHPILVKKGDKNVLSLIDVLPEEFREEGKDVLNKDVLRIYRKGDYRLFFQKIESAPWTMVALQKKQSLFTTVFSRWGSALLFVLLGVIVLIVVTNQLIFRDFVRPARELVSLIENEGISGKAELGGDLPPSWRPWFWTVVNTFSKNRELVSDLNGLLGALEEKVTERTRELEESTNKLRTTQAYMIHSEKMASLGHLIAGIAHEINTPMGAIRGSTDNLLASIKNSIGGLSRMLEILNPQELDLFFKSIEPSTSGAQQLSSQEERLLIKRTIERLEEAPRFSQGLQLTDRERIAEIFVLMGIDDRLDEFWSLIESKDAPEIWEVAYAISRQMKSVHTIKQATERMSKIIFALRQSSRMGTSDILVMADVIEGIENVLTLYNNQIKQGIDVVRKYDKLSPLLCRPDALIQVWTNLIHNAIFAMDAKMDAKTNEKTDGRTQGRGILEIVARQNGKGIKIDIVDSGPGIPKEILNKIFDPFFTTKAPGEGTGLGLDISRQIVEKHGGHIEVDSIPGRTVFSVFLPFDNMVNAEGQSVDTLKEEPGVEG